jgi:hypothetical protein
MINRLFKRLSALLSSQKDYKMQTFTFFLPTPPPRSSGYREKNFDKLFYEFINRGYRVIKFTTQAASAGEKQSGMWIICLVQATNDAAESLNLDELFMDKLKSKSAVKEEIEGLYYIDDQANEL